MMAHSSPPDGSRTGGDTRSTMENVGAVQRDDSPLITPDRHPEMIVITSWDDGHPQDMHLADLLHRHGIEGTFFVPVRNIEGHATLGPAELRDIAARFEIGSHTLNHVRLDGLAPADAEAEIRNGKEELESIVGQPVEGFCYPGGRVPHGARGMLQRNGISYARTIESFRLDCGDDPYQIPTTLQVFPHRRLVYAANYVKGANYFSRFRCFKTAFLDGSIWSILNKFATHSAGGPRILHIWGHSRELAELDLWDELDLFFTRLMSCKPTVMSLANLAASIRPSNEPDDAPANFSATY